MNLSCILWLAASTTTGPMPGPIQDADHPVTRAFERCAKAPPETQKAVVESIRRRVLESDDPGIQQLLVLANKARKELEVAPEPDEEFFDPETYARGQRVVRRFVDPHSDAAKIKLGTYRAWESEYPFAYRVRYDFGNHTGLEKKAALSPLDELWNYLYGYPPDADRLVAYLEQLFDHDHKHTPVARHFSRVYCDLNANAYSGITLFDAFASKEKIDMPDVDVIAFARHVKKDNSFRSPIPPNSRRTRLYSDIKRTFLPYFQHRTFVEAAATLYLDPEAPLRPEHEPLRQRLLYLFSISDGDVDKIRAYFKKSGDRNNFILEIDQESIADPAWQKNEKKYAGARNAVRWAIAEMAYAVLREHGFLTD